MKPAKIIRDPIHGSIELNELELELIDSPQLQRLRNIKQNGLCFLIYPAMNSTRFEHSLGVMYLAGVLSDHLELDKNTKQLLRVAGLLHDIGHCAFSHTSDDLLVDMGYSHEENAVKLIAKTEIGDILDRFGMDLKKVSNLINGKGNFGKIISSEIDIDKMDYLIRDSYYAGVAYGIIDLERIIRGMKLYNNELVIRKGNREAVEALLISRNMMYETVYRHHTKRIIEAMFKRALKRFIYKEDIDYEEFIGMDDIDLVYRLRNTSGYPKEIMDRVDERRLFKIAYSGKTSGIEENFRRDMLENEDGIGEKIAEDFGIESGYVLVDMPETKMSEFRIRIESEDGLKYIHEVSTLARSLKESEEEKMNFSIYVPPEDMRKLRRFEVGEYIEFSQRKLERFI